MPAQPKSAQAVGQGEIISTNILAPEIFCSVLDCAILHIQVHFIKASKPQTGSHTHTYKYKKEVFDYGLCTNE